MIIYPNFTGEKPEDNRVQDSILKKSQDCNSTFVPHHRVTPEILGYRLQTLLHKGPTERNHVAIETAQNSLLFINHALSPWHSIQEDRVLEKGWNSVLLLPRNFPIALQDRKWGPWNWLSTASQRDGLTGEPLKCVFKGRSERKKTTRRWKISRNFLSGVKVVMEFCPC